MGKSEKLPNTFTENLPWGEATHPIWPATQLLLKRNLEAYPFPSKLQDIGAGEIVEKLGSHLNNFHCIHANALSPHQKELLFEHFILHEGFEKKKEGCAFLVDDTGHFLGLINLEDHLHLRTTTFSHNLFDAWKGLSHIERKLSHELTFAFSPRFGYLTSDPAFCGTALTIQAFLHIPALLHLEKFRDLAETLSESITVKGLGHEGEYLGDFILIENTFTLGVSEESILKTVFDTANLFMKAEEDLRKTLDIPNSPLLRDKIGRSMGMLSYGSALQIQETLSSLSLIGLGKELGWIDRAETFHFFNLFFSSRRAHLSELLKNEHMTKDELPILRASYLRKEISLLDPSKLFSI